jgi:hypothetical protein
LQRSWIIFGKPSLLQNFTGQDFAGMYHVEQGLSGSVAHISADSIQHSAHIDHPILATRKHCRTG